MGIIVGDLSKPIKDEDMPYLDLMLSLIKKHQEKASECATDLSLLDQTRSMLDYSKRNRIKVNNNNDIALHVLLLQEEDTQRQLAYQQLIQHTSIAKIFEDDLKSFLVMRYRVHRSVVDEWHIDLEKRELFRRTRVGQGQPQEAQVREETTTTAEITQPPTEEN